MSFWYILYLNLALGAVALPQTPPTCIDGASNGLTFATANSEWVIECNVDRWGNDIAAQQYDTFESCIRACDALPHCVDVSYVGTSCYMKNAISPTVTPQNNCWTAKRVSSGSQGGNQEEQTLPLSCIDKKDDGALYQTSKGAFKVVCGIDHAGNDIGASQTATFEQCIDTCATTAGCVDVAYVWGSCYMKNGNGNEIALQHVWSAVLQVSSTPTIPANPTATNTPSNSTSTSTSNSTLPLSCENGRDHRRVYGSSSGGTYLIECGIDYAGGDLLATNEASFEDCLSTCDKNPQCVDVSYVYGSCYLKKELNAGIPLAHVSSAKVLRSSDALFAIPSYAPQAIGDGEEIVSGEPIVLPPQPTATLSPAPPPGIDMGGLGVLTPDEQAKIWYNSDSSEDEDSVTVRLTVDYKHPSIILDYSIYIKDVTCVAGALTGRFDASETTTPFFYAIRTWPQDEKVILVTSSASCSPGLGQNAFFVAESIVFTESSRNFRALGAKAELADIYNNMDIDFGKIVPDRNRTVNFDNSTCGSPSQASFNGLPAVACGSDFDSRLDSQLTFYSDELEGTTAILEAASVALVTHQPSRLRHRGLGSWISNLGRSIVNGIVGAATAVVERVAPLVIDIGNQIVSVAKDIVDVGVAIVTNAVKLIAFVFTGDYDNELVLPFDLGPSRSLREDTPFGPAHHLYTFRRARTDPKYASEKASLENTDDLTGVDEEDAEPSISLWCINCGIRGRFIAQGAISVSPVSGFSKGEISIRGDLYAGAYLGVNAFANYEHSSKRQIAKLNLAGWKIPNIIEMGPAITLAIEASVSATAQGQIKTGASITWPNFSAKLDFVNARSSSVSGFVPRVDSQFEAWGSIEAEASLGLPIGLEFGIDVLGGLISKSVGLYHTPSLKASAEFSAAIGGSQGTFFGSESCAGIDWELHLINVMSLGVEDLVDIPLVRFATPRLASGCIGRARQPEQNLPSSVSSSTRASTSTLSSLTTSTSLSSTLSTTSSLATSTLASSTSSVSSTTSVLTSSTSTITTTTTTSSSVCVVSPTTTRLPTTTTLAPLPAQSSIVCPRDNSRTWIDPGPNRDEFVISCTRDINNNDITQNWSTTMEQCLISCAAFDGCTGVVFYRGGPTDAMRRAGRPSCWLKSSTASTRTGVGWGGLPLDSAWMRSPFSVSSVIYADTDITTNAVTRFARGNRLVIDTNNLATLTGNLGDPWPGVQKSLSMLYSYRGEQRQFTASDFMGEFIIRHGPLSAATAPRSNLLPDFPPSCGNTWLKIIAITWGPVPVTSTTVAARLYESSVQNTPWLWNNANMGGETFVGLPKTGVVFFREYTPGSIFTGNLRVMTGKQDASSTWWRPSTKRGIEAPTPKLIARQEGIVNSTGPWQNSTSELLRPTSLTSSSGASNLTESVSSNSSFATVSLNDVTGSLKLNPGVDGNLFLSDLSDDTNITSLTTSSFQATIHQATTAIYGDSSDRYLHYYPSSISSVGVSRLRLSTVSKLPKGARFISLVELHGNNGHKMLVGVDSSGNYNYLMMCGIQGQLNKIFLVRDLVSSPAVLKSDEAKFTITGGQAGECVPIAITVAASEAFVPDEATLRRRKRFYA